MTLVEAVSAALATNADLRGLLAAELRAVANEIKAEDDLISQRELADKLGVTPRTLSDNHVAWGLDKSLRFGPDKPFYFRSQVAQRAREKVIKGKQPEPLRRAA